jgi:hypothetical protein
LTNIRKSDWCWFDTSLHSARPFQDRRCKCERRKVSIMFTQNGNWDQQQFDF